MRLPATARIGALAFLGGCGLLAYALTQLAPPVHVALDMPIDLNGGQVRDASIDLHPHTLYVVEVVLQDFPLEAPAKCDPYDVLASAGAVLDSSGHGSNWRSGPNYWREDSALRLSKIYPDASHRNVSVNFGTASACLNAYHPRLKIYSLEPPEDNYVPAVWLSVWLIAIGAVLGVQTALKIWRPAYNPPRMLPELVLRQVIAWHPQRAMARLSAVPVNFITVLVGLELVLLTIFMTITPVTPQGLTLDLAPRQLSRAVDSPWRETMSVYVSVEGVFYVNGEAAGRNELASRVKEELGRRLVSAVYVDGADSVEAMDVIYAIDQVQSAGGEVLLVTPAVRRKWDEQAAQQKR
jgi:biopolymer transport protein ExbD